VLPISTVRQERPEGGLDFHSVVAALRRRLPIIVLCAVVVPAAAVALTWSKDDVYTASASLLFRDPALDQKLFGSSVLESSQDPTREAATNVRLVSLDVVRRRTERRLHGHGLGGGVSVASDGNSNVVTITATSSSARRAARIANAFANEYIAFRREADRAKIRDAQQLIESELAELRTQQGTEDKVNRLEQRVSELDVLASLQTGNAELVQAATVPTAPTSQSKSRRAMLGLGLGLLLGIGLALLLDRLDRRVRDPDEVEELLDRPVLAAVPRSSALSRQSLEERPLTQSAAESFRMLRANLRYFNVDKNIRTVLITSAAPGEGKSVVAWNLAATAGGAGAKVLLIEADLRHPNLPRRPPDAYRTGLSRVLAGQVRPEDAIFGVPAEIRTDGAAGAAPTVDVLFAGPLPPNPTDLIESDSMAQLIRQAEGIYDLVVIDTPPTSVVSDAIPLVTQVSGVIVVVRIGMSSRDSVAHLRNQLQNLRAPVLGAVVNGLDTRRDRYGYGYSYTSPSLNGDPRRDAPRDSRPKMSQLFRR
jgi:succinoglycan biosynthesis transport protein ExoP